MSFIVGNWTWLPLSYFLLGNPEIIFIPKFLSCAGHKHGGGENSCCWDRCFFSPTKARSPCFNVKTMHTVVHFKHFVCFIRSKTACIWLKIQNHQQANYIDSSVNVYMVVNEWDATFYSKLNTLNIYNFGFNKIFPGNLASSMIPVLSNSTWMWQACNQTSENLLTQF